MTTVYEIKANGYLGTSKQIDPREGVSAGWTYHAPPSEGVWRWEHGDWVAAAAEPAVVEMAPVEDIVGAAADARSQRNALLTACDWTQIADAPVDKEAWATYRQALRDITTQDGFPLSIDWPVAP